MKVITSRFGALEVQEVDIIQIPDGLLGFETLTKFFIVDPADETLILWLQSSENPDVAFPILEPKIFKSDYKVHLSANELRALRVESLKQRDILVYCVLTIPDDITKMTANMKAPLVINAAQQVGRQVVLQENEYNVRASIYRELLTLIMSMGTQASATSKAAKSVDESFTAAALSLKTASSKVEVVAL